MDDRKIKDLLDYLTLCNLESPTELSDYLVDKAKQTLWNRLIKEIPKETLEALKK